MRRISAMLLIFLVLVPAEGLAESADDIVRSFIFPGWGQYRTGRFTRGTIMMGSALVTLAGIGGLTLQYNRYVDSYEDAELLYNSSSYIGELKYYHSEMKDKWNKADEIYGYRKTLIGVAIGVWAWSAIDMLIGSEAAVPPISLEVKSDGFLVVHSFSF